MNVYRGGNAELEPIYSGLDIHMVGADKSFQTSHIYNKQGYKKTNMSLFRRHIILNIFSLFYSKLNEKGQKKIYLGTFCCSQSVLY